MPAYEICYLEEDGALACAFSVQFDTNSIVLLIAFFWSEFNETPTKLIAFDKSI